MHSLYREHTPSPNSVKEQRIDEHSKAPLPLKKGMVNAASDPLVSPCLPCPGDLRLLQRITVQSNNTHTLSADPLFLKLSVLNKWQVRNVHFPSWTASYSENTNTHTHLTQEFTESQDKRMQLLFLSHFLPLSLSHQFCVFPSSLQQILRRQPQITAYTHTLTQTRQHFWKLATSTFTLYHRYETPAVLTSCTDGSTASILVVLNWFCFRADFT